MDDKEDYSFIWIDCPGCGKLVIAVKAKKAANVHPACGTTYSVVKNRDKFQEGDDS